VRNPPGSLTAERLRELLSYAPDTGEFRWLVKGGGRLGSVAGCIEKRTHYRMIQINGDHYQAARLAWLHVHGAWPAKPLKFLNTVPDDNRIANLAEVVRHPAKKRQRAAYGRYQRAGKPLSYRAYDLKRSFGITMEQYQAAFVAQKGCCAICEKAETQRRNGQLKWLAVDHCHENGTLRGLLCANCNNGIGRFGDNEVTLRRAADYLARHKSDVKDPDNVIRLSGRRLDGRKGLKETA
jgi:hypothetical protein